MKILSVILLLFSTSLLASPTKKPALGPCDVTINNYGDCDFNVDIHYKDVSGPIMIHSVYVAYNTFQNYSAPSNCHTIVGITVYDVSGGTNNAYVDPNNTLDQVGCSGTNDVTWISLGQVDITP